MGVRTAIFGVVLAALLVTACSSTAERTKGSEEVLRLGVFPNLTHAPAYVALEEGIFERVLAPTKVEVKYFNSGSDAGTALSSGSIDASYIGPGPAIGLFVQDPESIRVVSGVTSGGASLVVARGSGISSAEDLRGKKIAVPGIGNTQDVALRTWLHDEGLKTNDEGGDVFVGAIDNTALVQTFEAGEFDAAWEPEPWPSLLIAQELAEPFLDEAGLWPEGEFVTTHLVVTTGYLDAHPKIVQRLVQANAEAIEVIAADPVGAKAAAQAGLVKAGAPSLDQAVVDEAWNNLTFTWDPIASSLQKDAEDAYALGYLESEPEQLVRIYALDDLEAVLAELPEIPAGLPREIPVLVASK
ncbi:MAG TPA: ABC transporter substrate-binding protein [Actinomycetota bacterium]|nr:ABC transporter substrate-binding protein [Actinomycetota bacterium]